MKFNKVVESDSTEVLNPDWNSNIEPVLKNIQNERFVLILTAQNGDYVQCTGLKKRLTIEYRTYNENGFKHFVIGYPDPSGPLNASWTNISGLSGETLVKNNEVLKMDDVESVFSDFFNHQCIPEKYQKRNISKLFK